MRRACCPRCARPWQGSASTSRRSANIILDTEQRPTKTPRAYCAPVRVPEEVYLVVPRVGGREDFAALFHEGGHAEHYANMDPALPVEYRYLGDNSVTESFAFLLEHITEDPLWLAEALGADPDPIVAHVRAVRLFFLRRYAAKLAYELELHGPGADLDAMPGRYAELLGDGHRASAGRRRPGSTTSTSGFYVAAYLRAWALEARWRAHLRERFGERWFSEPAAGEWLDGLWSQGQRLRADELLAEATGEELRLRARLRRTSPCCALAAASSRPRRRRPCGSSLSLLVVAHLAQLGRGQVGEARLDLRRGQLVVGGDREAAPDAGSAAQPVGLGQGPVGGVADDPAGAAGGALDLAAGLAGAWVARLRTGADRPRTSLRAWLASRSRSLSMSVGLLAAAADQVGDQLLGVAAGHPAALTASSATSCTRSRLRVRLRSRLERKLSMLLSRPVVGVLERLAELAVDFRAVLLRACSYAQSSCGRSTFAPCSCGRSSSAPSSCGPSSCGRRSLAARLSRRGPLRRHFVPS